MDLCGLFILVTLDLEKVLLTKLNLKVPLGLMLVKLDLMFPLTVFTEEDFGLLDLMVLLL